MLSRAVEISRLLEGRKSFISHIVHDEVVIDLCDEERELLAEVRDIFETDEFRTNVQAGKNYLELEELKV